MLESEFTAARAKQAIDFLDQLPPEIDAYDLATGGELRYLDGYRLYLDARFRKAPGSRERFCDWLQRFGYWPE